MENTHDRTTCTRVYSHKPYRAVTCIPVHGVYTRCVHEPRLLCSNVVIVVVVDPSSNSGFGFCATTHFLLVARGHTRGLANGLQVTCHTGGKLNGRTRRPPPCVITVQTWCVRNAQAVETSTGETTTTTTTTKIIRAPLIKNTREIDVIHLCVGLKLSALINYHRLHTTPTSVTRRRRRRRPRPDRSCCGNNYVVRFAAFDAPALISFPRVLRSFRHRRTSISRINRVY